MDVSDIFYFFSARGGEGGVRGPGGGGVWNRFMSKIPGRGGVGLPGREGPMGWEGVCGELGIFLGGGGGAKYFFSGPK